MLRLQHSIRKQTLELEVASEALALALQPRLGEINRQYFLPIMERVFDELGTEGRHIRISKLRVDLGDLPFARFEEVAAERFYHGLRRALEEELRRQEQNPTPGNRSQTAEASRLELLEHYLLHGTLPFWASHGAAFSFEELFSELANGDSAGLVRSIKKHGRQRRVLERLVLQLGEATLLGLLRLLEPEYAALIIAYMINLREIHRAEPIVRLSDNQFARFLWVLVLSYLVSDRGTQFNRKSFVRWLLEGMADGEGLDYKEIVATLHMGLLRTKRNRSLEASLTAIIGELVHELNLDATGDERARPSQSRPGRQTEQTGNEALAAIDSGPQTAEASRLELLEHYLLHGTLPFTASRTEAFSFEACLMELAGSDAAGLIKIIKKHSHHRRVLERLVLQLGEEQLRHLVHLLEPEYAVLIIAYMIDLREIHRAEPVVRLSERELARFLWILVLTYLAQERGSQFNRKSFVKSLFEGMAESDGLGYAEIIALARLGMRKTEKSRPLESSLTAIIGELIYELDKAEFREQNKVQAGVQAAESASTIDHASTKGDAGEALARLEFYLDKGPEIAGEAWKGKADIGGLLSFLAAHDASRARQLIQQLARRHERGLTSLVERLLRAFPPEDLLALLAPEQKELLAVLVEVLSSARARIAHSGRARHAAPDSIFWKATLECLLSEPSSRWSRRVMVRQVLEVVAEGLGISPGWLAETAAGVLEQTPATGTSSLAQVLETVRQDFDERSRPTSHARPALTRYDRVEVIRYYLLYGVLPWSAICRDPALTVAYAFASLPGLSRSQLGAVFSQENPDEQLQAVLRAIRMMPEESLARLLLRLLPRAEEADSPFRSALPMFASRAEDKHAFYARLLAAILNGRSLDLEEFASSASIQTPEVVPALARDVSEWDAHLLKSALASRLRFGESSHQGEPAQSALLDALITKHPQEVRHFCRALRDTPGLLDALLRQCSASHFDRLFELLCAADLPTLDALLRSIAGIASTYRSHPEESPRQVIFQELLRLDEGQPLTDIFFVRVLCKLYGTPLPHEVRELLLAEVAAWATYANLPAAHVKAFEAAITANGREKGASIRKPSALCDAVLALLLEEGRTPHTPVESHAEAGASRLESLSDDALRHTLTVMLEDAPQDVYAFITQHVLDSRKREHWIKILPESVLARLSYLLEPRAARALLDAAEVLASAWLETASTVNQALTERGVLWSFLLEFLAHNTDDDRSVERLVAAFFEYMAAHYRAQSLETTEPLSVGTLLLEQADRLAVAAGQVHLRAILRRQRARLLAPWELSAPAETRPATEMEKAYKLRAGSDQDRRPRPERGRTAFSMKTDEEDDAAAEPIYINNAGLVLTGPFLPHFFQTLDMLHTDDEGRTRLRDRETISRAVHLLQYLVDGSTNAPEPSLVLNKLLCGIPVSNPVALEIEPTKEEREVCEQLLRAMLANWKIISNTSIAGLQETFFRREGRLEHANGEWRLRVQRKTVDVLVDQIPWSISVIFHRWMTQPLYVDW